jgi:hypothetical protein
MAALYMQGNTIFRLRDIFHSLSGFFLYSFKKISLTLKGFSYTLFSEI